MIDARGRMPPVRFADRTQAGQLLAEALVSLVEPQDAVVLALPRGGVPVGYEVARRLGCALDVILVRKLGVPWQPELAFGAVATRGIVVLNMDHVRALGIPQDVIDDAVERERLELERRERLYRDDHGPIDLRGKTAIVVDDGIATGSTVRAALASLAERGVARRIVASPVAAAETVRGLRDEADRIVCLHTPVSFIAVGAWYEDFAPVSDAEVKQLLERAARETPQSVD